MDNPRALRRRRVLIVVSSYAPTMIADMQRARHLAWELPKLGWDVEILAPDQSYQPISCIDEDSVGLFPSRGKVSYAPPFLPQLFRCLRMRTIGWRALFPMFRQGNRILSSGVDVVYFSTTQFCLFLLGPLWRARFGVPYVLDFHDPCVKEGHRLPIWAKPKLRHIISRRLMTAVEAISVRGASALVSVSPHYLERLRERYVGLKLDWTKENTTAVLPFGVLEQDISLEGSGDRGQSLTPDKQARIIYVGAGGPIMHRSFGILCQALATLRESAPSLVSKIRVELYGTVLGWCDGDPRYLANIAQKAGVGDIVAESPSRVSYRQSMRLLAESAGALILGVDEAGYMPSKLFPYASSGKPLLAVIRRDGPAYVALRSMPSLGHALWFDDSAQMPSADMLATLREFLEEVVANCSFNRADAVRPFMASEMAARHVDLFETVLANS